MTSKSIIKTVINVAITIISMSKTQVWSSKGQLQVESE